MHRQRVRHILKIKVDFPLYNGCRSQWPRGLRCSSADPRMLRLWVRIPPDAWMSVCCECCVLSGRGLCDELIIRPEESYRLWCDVMCDLETSGMRRPWPMGAVAPKTNKQTNSWCWVFFKECTAHHTPPSTAQVNSAQSYTSTPWSVLMAYGN